jgi:hypothetical protein
MESEIWELGVGDNATVVRDKYRTGLADWGGQHIVLQSPVRDIFK